MLKFSETRRAISLFEYIVANSTDKFTLEAVVSNLWKSYVAQDDWFAMDKLITQYESDKRIHFRLDEQLLQLSLTAAKCGAKTEAMGFFHNWSNQDRRLAPNFSSLTDYGLVKELKLFYDHLEEDEPRCETPKRVMREVGI